MMAVKVWPSSSTKPLFLVKIMAPALVWIVAGNDVMVLSMSNGPSELISLIGI